MTQVSDEYAYLTIPPATDFRPCVGLILAGMAVRAKVGVGGLDDAVESLERFHSGDSNTRYRFSLGDNSVVVEVEGASSEWRSVVELIS